MKCTPAGAAAAADAAAGAAAAKSVIPNCRIQRKASTLPAIMSTYITGSRRPGRRGGRPVVRVIGTCRVLGFGAGVGWRLGHAARRVQSLPP